MIVNYHFQSLLFVVLLRMVAAQESPFDLDPVRVSSSSTSPKDAQTHSVAVGKVCSSPFSCLPLSELLMRYKGNHQFVPDTIQALVGDIIGEADVKWSDLTEDLMMLLQSFNFSRPITPWSEPNLEFHASLTS